LGPKARGVDLVTCYNKLSSPRIIIRYVLPVDSSQLRWQVHPASVYKCHWPVTGFGLRTILLGRSLVHFTALKLVATDILVTQRDEYCALMASRSGDGIVVKAHVNPHAEAGSSLCVLHTMNVVQRILQALGNQEAL
jgi:hypothetical protein